jgi:hypothetical protein
MSFGSKKWLAAVLIAASLTFSTTHSPSSRGMGSLAMLINGQVVAGGIVLAVTGSTIVTGFSMMFSDASSSVRTVGMFMVLGGWIVLPSSGVPEFSPIEYGQFELSDDEVDEYNDLIPALNAQSRIITQDLASIELDQAEKIELARQRWNDALAELDADSSVRETLSVIVESEAAIQD